MARKRKLFGTDGIRGLANRFPVNSEMAMMVGSATAQVLLQHSDAGKRTSWPRPRIVIGKDTRLSGYMLEQALASGICAKGADVLLVGPMPTPAISFLVTSMRADAGFVISASHNSYEDNGIKIFDHNGYKLPDETEDQIEDLVLGSVWERESDREAVGGSRPIHDKIGRAVRVDDAGGRYIVHLKTMLPKGFHLQDIPIVLDCAHGAAYKVGPQLFKELGAKVIKRGAAPDGTNINHRVGALFPNEAAGAVVEFGARLGISLDGDADRIILSDENGDIVDGDQIMGICALELKRQKKLEKNTVVMTPMSNMGLELMLKENGIKCERVPVGDRHVVERLRSENLSFGGEQSGHLVFHENATTGDGLLAGLKVLEIMMNTGKPLSELKKEIPLLPQVRNDVRVRVKEDFDNLPEVKKLVAEAEKQLKGRGRVFIRYSGTEPLVRVMLEGEDQAQIGSLCRGIAGAFHKAIGERRNS